MAGGVIIKNVWRPNVPTYTSGVGTGHEPADFLTVHVDRYDNGRCLEVLHLDFSDYAGLEAEWEAKSATTVLTSSITTAIAARSWDEEQLTSTQRAFIGTEFTET